jgi:FMN reductase (NADPH)
MNEAIQAMQARSSVRSFDPRPLEPAHEQAILAAALRAPTAGNMMLYTILRIHDEKTRRALAETCDHQPFIAQAPLTLVFLADFTRWTELFEAAGVPELAREQGFPWQGPSMGDFLLCCSDALIAAQNAVIAAQSLGVGSCYIGDIMEQYETHRELFKLPPQAFPIAMLVLGYPKDGKMPAPRKRFDAKYIIHDEVYRDFPPQELLCMVEREEGHTQEPIHGVAPAEYVRRFFLRKQGAEFAREMARSAQAGLKAFMEEGRGNGDV